MKRPWESVSFFEVKVFASDCETPLQGARLDIWHADHEGAYDDVGYQFPCRSNCRRRWFLSVRYHSALGVISTGRRIVQVISMCGCVGMTRMVQTISSPSSILRATPFSSRIHGRKSHGRLHSKVVRVTGGRRPLTSLFSLKDFLV